MANFERHIVLGGTGQVGAAVTRALLEAGEVVTVVTRDADHARDLAEAGAEVAVADLRDVDRLRKVFRGGSRAFLLNPPADPSGDTDTEERETAAAIVAALDGSRLEKVVAASTYGARPGDACGDLTVLHDFEGRLAAQSVPAAINRGAYYMSNWTGMIDAVRETGRLPSFFPAGHVLPMVAPEDVGRAAARRLMAGPDDIGLNHVEGPERYTPRDVARAFAAALERDVALDIVPRDALEETFSGFGFSDAAARSYARMTAATIDDVETPDAPERGDTTLDAYIASAVAASGGDARRNGDG